MVQLNWEGTCDEWEALKEKKEQEEKMNIDPSEAYKTYIDKLQKLENDPVSHPAHCSKEVYDEICARLIADENASNETKERIKNILNWHYGLLGKNINDPVSHPAHYTSGKIECIDYIEDKQLGFHLGNAVKYITRAGKKSPDKKIEDLRKAMWYIDRYIQLEEQRERDEVKEMIGNRTE